MGTFASIVLENRNQSLTVKIANTPPQSALLNNIIAFPKPPRRKARPKSKAAPQPPLRDDAAIDNVYQLFPVPSQAAACPRDWGLVADACQILAKRSGALGLSTASGYGLSRPFSMSLMMRS